MGRSAATRTTRRGGGGAASIENPAAPELVAQLHPLLLRIGSDQAGRVQVFGRRQPLRCHGALLGQRAGGVLGRHRMGLAVARDPALHLFGLRRRTGRQQFGACFRPRPIQPADDLGTVAGLDTRAFGDPWRYAPATLARELSMASVARVALDGDRVIGYATAVVREGGGHINRIAVDPEAQGRGVGKALLADINGQLDLMGANRITLNTQRSNVISQRLYRSSGFKIVGPPLRVYHRPLA